MNESACYRIHVLELVSSLDKGGRTVRILEGARCLQEGGFEISVRSFSPPAPWVTSRWPEIKDIERIEKKKGIDPACILRLCKLIRKNKIDILHAHTEDALLYGGLAARIMRIPAIGTFHRSRPECYEPTLKSRIWNRLMAKQIAVSKSFRTLMIGRTNVPANRVSVIHGSVDMSRFPMVDSAEKAAIRQRLNIPLDAPILLSMGHLGPIKGHDVVLRAMPSIHRHFPKAKLYIAGDGSDDERGELESLANDLAIANDTILLGQIHNPAEWFAACDLFVLSPRQEAFGLVFVEAASSGRPAIASRIGGIPEIVEHDKTGLLVEPEDSKGIANAVLELLHSPERIEAMGVNARRHAAAHFSNECLARAYANLILALVPSAKANGHLSHCAQFEQAIYSDAANTSNPSGMHFSAAAEH